MVKILTIPEAAYHAAAMDGEGSIGVNRSKAGRHRQAYTLRVEVTNTEREFVDYLSKTAGCGTVTPHSRGNPRNKDAYVWSLRSWEYVDYLNQLLPYLTIKKSRALLFMEFLTHYKDHRGTLSEHDRMMRSVICDEMIELNKRGQ